MRTSIIRFHLSFFLIFLVTILAAARTIEFETTQVTAADVTLSPDGQWLIFTMLGHLFRLPVEGGTAEQLTFGPYYDTDPVFSPGGSRVAFVSDRDGSEGNVFVLELATGQITQVTHEPWAGRPTWTPDGKGMVYLLFVGGRKGCPSSEALIRRVAFSGEEPETLSAPPRVIRSVFYLPDGRLAWTVIDSDPHVGKSNTRIEALSPQGAVSTLRTVDGLANRIVPSPTGDGFYGRRRRYLPGHGFFFQPDDLLFLPLPEGTERAIAPLSGAYCFYGGTQLAVAPDNQSIYLGEAGRLWKIILPSGTREPIDFTAKVRLVVQDPSTPPKPALTASAGLVPSRSVLDPRLSPDDRSLVIGALGFLWKMPLNGGPAKRLFQGSAFEQSPAFSPDGKQLAFVHSQYGKQEVRVYNFESAQTRTLASGRYFWNPSWSGDGQQVVFAEYNSDTFRVMAVNLSDGTKVKLAEVGTGYWPPRPHLSTDGEFLYFTGKLAGISTLYRLPLKEKGKPQAITQLARHLSDGLVSPDGKWLAFRRNTEIWVAPLGEGPVKDENVRQLSAEGGDTFAYTPDSSAVIYAVGNRVWRHPLEGGDRQEIPIGLELQIPTPPPLLLRRVRVLDFDEGGFGRETSLYIEQGRVRWVGSERRHQLAPRTVIVDGGGRFAVPGLFDLHVHSEAGWANRDLFQEAFLAYGITSVRDTGERLAWLTSLADRSETTSEPMPRYFFSGEFFQRAQGIYGNFGMLIYSEDDARIYVRRHKELGAHFIKVHHSLSWPLQRAMAEEARRQGLPLVGHGTTVREVTQSAILGYASLEHLNSPQRFYDDVFELLKLAGIRWVPTLVEYGGHALLLRDEPERLADAKLRAFTPEWAIRETGEYLRFMDDQALRGYQALQLAGIRAAHRRGVRIHAGTDAGSWLLPGATLHWELELLVQAGLPPLDVLRIATQQAAESVGAEDDLGTLEPGKLADIVLLDRNPLEDIKNTQTIWRVIKGGWLFDPDKLRPPVSTSPDE